MPAPHWDLITKSTALHWRPALLRAAACPCRWKSELSTERWKAHRVLLIIPEDHEVRMMSWLHASLCLSESRVKSCAKILRCSCRLKRLVSIWERRPDKLSSLFAKKCWCELKTTGGKVLMHRTSRTLTSAPGAKA